MLEQQVIIPKFASLFSPCNHNVYKYYCFQRGEDFPTHFLRMGTSTTKTCKRFSLCEVISCAKSVSFITYHVV